MALQFWNLTVFGVISAVCSIGYATTSEARIANLHSYCAAHRSAKAGVEEGDEDIPKHAPVARPATWRCEDGKVLVCALGASGDDCSPTSPYDADRRRAFQQFCQQNPGSDYIPHSLTMGLHSEWRCSSRTPVQIRSWPLGPHGYVRGAWKRLS